MSRKLGIRSFIVALSLSVMVSLSAIARSQAPDAGSRPSASLGTTSWGLHPTTFRTGSSSKIRGPSPAGSISATSEAMTFHSWKLWAALSESHPAKLSRRQCAGLHDMVATGGYFLAAGAGSYARRPMLDGLGVRLQPAARSDQSLRAGNGTTGGRSPPRLRYPAVKIRSPLPSNTTTMSTTGAGESVLQPDRAE